MTELAEEDARWLVGTDGLQAVAEATRELDAGRDELAVNRLLRAGGLPASRAIAVVGAARSRQRARARWKDADRLLFTPQALEQASDPEVAAWRARRVAGAEVWDLCAGAGGDALAFAAAGATVTAVDHDPARLVLLEHNAAVIGVEVRIRCADVLSVTPPTGALVHVDPSRRDAGRRVRRLAHHRPPVGALLRHLDDAAGVAVVLSPAVPLDDPDLPPDAELEFVQVGPDLIEATAWLAALRSAAAASATLLPGGHHRVRHRPVERLPVGPVGSHLVEVAPAAVRARLHDAIGRDLGARRVAARRALLTTDEPAAPSPWYRTWPVEAVLPARPGRLRAWLADAEPAPLEISVHGLDTEPARWWRALGRPPRGPTGRRVALVRTDDGAVAVVCGGVTTGPPDARLDGPGR